MGILEGQIGLVTGASSGIGRAVALSLAAQGVQLGVVGRDLETLATVATTARGSGVRVQGYHADFTKDEDITRLASRLRQDFGHIDILVHSAGIHTFGRVATVPVEEFDRQYQVNVRAPYVLTQTLLPMFRPHRGQIVFVNSSVGLYARANVGQYAATKHALKAVADSLRDEVNPEGLRVLSVFLGRTATPLQAIIHQKEGRSYHPERLIQPKDVAAVVLNALSLPWTAEVTEIKIRPFLKLD
jgi:NAD(P)-dependent dehydrogenase (short-subunit alcohol dehydrogenase family)